ncbi:hypothetical protein evm_003614 [Chilo suppressalis]|nr:hypothetical protein evm_003614 [Chilo suppressalis]
MKLLVLCAVLSVLAMAATMPAEVAEDLRANPKLLMSGDLNGTMMSAAQWILSEDSIITSYKFDRIQGEAIVERVAGGVGTNYLSVRIRQPLLSSPRFVFRYEIFGTQPTA